MLVHANRHFLRACRATDGAAPTAPSRPVRRRPGAPGRRALVRAGRPHRGAVRHRLCARDAPRAGAQPARGVPLHPRAPSPTLRRPLARFAGSDGAARRGAAQHGGADAGLAAARPTSSMSISRAAWACRWSKAATWWRATASCRSRPWPACAPCTCCCAGSTRAFVDPLELRADSRARRHRPGRGHAHRHDRARQRAGLGPRRDAGADAVPRAPVAAALGQEARTAVARRVVAGRALGLCLRDGQPRRHDRAALPRPGSRADRRRHARARRAQGAGGQAAQPARPVRRRNIPSCPRSARSGTATASRRRPSCCAAS